MKYLVTFLTTLVTFVFSGGAAAQIAVPKELQGKTISIVVPWGPGGQSDVWNRITAARFKEITGLNVIVVNKPGADGQIGVAEVANSAPDGTTLLATDNGFILSPMFKDVNAVPRDKLVTVLVSYRSSQGFYVRADSKYQTFKDLLDDIKKNPNKINIGSNYPLAVVIHSRVMNQINSQSQYVNYKGQPQVTSDLLGGHLDAMIAPPIVLPQVRAGKMRALAFSSADRLAEFPTVDQISSAVPGFSFENFAGVYVPVGTPKHIVEFYNKTYREAFKDVAAQDFLKSTATRLFDGTPAEAEKFVQANENFWRPIVAKHHK